MFYDEKYDELHVYQTSFSVGYILHTQCETCACSNERRAGILAEIEEIHTQSSSTQQLSAALVVGFLDQL